MPKLKAALIGHSFVRRYAEDRTGSSRPSPAIAASKMHVNELFSKVHVFGNDSFTIPQMRNNIHRAGALSLDCIVINTGSNDLCQRKCDIDDLVISLIDEAKFLLDSGARHITLLGVASRTRCREVTVFTFNERAQHFNRSLREAAEMETGIEFMYMKGFWRDTGGAELPVSRWSDDGIHPAVSETKREAGMDKYHRLIRRCLMRGAHFVHRS